MIACDSYLSLFFFTLQKKLRSGAIVRFSDNSSFMLFLLHVYTLYSRYNMDWINITEIGLDPDNSVIKRLWYIIILSLRDIWSRVLRLEGFSDYQYRYFICRQFATENEGDSDVILVKWWEGHIRPRVFSPQGMSVISLVSSPEPKAHR